MLDSLQLPDADQDARACEQTLFLARSSTPQQRLAWLENMLEAIGSERIEAHRKRAALVHVGV